MTEMTYELAKEWAEALRSGKYNQGKQCLRLGEKYCCLGVLADVMDPDGWDSGEKPDMPRRHRSMDDIDYISRDIIPIRDQDVFSRMNDNLNMSFKQIAEEVEVKYCGKL